MSASERQAADSLRRLRGFSPFVSMVFLNAFVDLGHKIIIQNTVFKLYDGQQQIILTAIVNALILLPFILLFSASGFLSDRYLKPVVMRCSAWAAVGITLLITVCYYQGWFWPAFCLTFIMAVQSAVYGPAKLGYIRELVGDDKLAAANGAVQAASIVGILFGTFVFSGLFEARLAGMALTDTGVVLGGVAVLGWALVGLSLLEALLSYRLPLAVSRADRELQFSRDDYLHFRYLRRNLGEVFGHRNIWFPIMGLATFWSVSQVLLAAFPAFAKETLAETNTLVIQGIMACAGIGIMAGSLLAGRISRNYIETGLIPLGALGICAGLLLVPAADSHFALVLAFILLGTMGGIYIVPLNALVQYHSPADKLGTILAGNNWVQNIAMTSFLVLTVVVAYFGLDSRGLLWTILLLALAGGIYTVCMLPHSLARMVLGFVLKHRYRIDVIGFHNLPREGAVLLLGNHISWIDWALVQIASPRPVRFVMTRDIYNLWYLRWLFRMVGVIPIGTAGSAGALREVTASLERGEVVCIFPEGSISRNGQLGKFHGGYERAVRDVVPRGVLVPFYLRGLWGSTFSRAELGLRKARSVGGRRDIIVAFGEPIALDTPVDQLKQKVFELSISAWEKYTDSLSPLPLAWFRTARRRLLKVCAVDGEGNALSNARMVTACLAFAGEIRRHTRDRNIGLVLPASPAAIFCNMAVMLLGRTTVNLNYTASVAAVQKAIESAGITTVFSSRLFAERLKGRGIDLDTMLAGTRVVWAEDLRDGIPRWRLLGYLATVWLLPPRVLYAVFGRRVRLDQPAAILFSSGSEGAPKGIRLSHRNIIANIRQISDVLNTREDDVIMGSLPPFHCFGLTVTSLMPVIEGIPVVCHPDPTDTLGVARAIARHRGTILCATATFLRMYTANRKVEPLMLDTLRIVVAGAEKLGERVREGFQHKFNKIVYEGYGTTETTPVASCNVPDALDTSDWRIQRGNSPGTVGLPLPGSCFRIVDPDTLETLPVGVDGLILISGTQVMLGYLNDEERTRAAIVEIDSRRWYRTGDKGHLDEEGFLTIVDRYSRFAKLGGEMVSLTAVEDAVRAVLDMPELDCVAINLEDAKKGERIVLLTVGLPDPKALRKQLVAAGINPLMIPQDFHAVESIPKLGSGKLDIAAARQLAAAHGI